MELVLWGGSPIDLPFVWRLPGKGDNPLIHWYHQPFAPVPTGRITGLRHAVHQTCEEPPEVGRRSALIRACAPVVSSLRTEPNDHFAPSTVKIRHIWLNGEKTVSRGT